MGIKRKRVVLHEAGHLVMAYIMGLDVVGCDISRSGERVAGELGKCVVFDPDPVGFRKFLLAMGGVMAENSFMGDDWGGFKDRNDAYINLYRYLSHYNRMPRYDILSPLLNEVSEIFYSDPSLAAVEEGAALLQKYSSVSGDKLHFLREKLEADMDLAPIRKKIDSLAEEEDPFSIAGSARWAFEKIGQFIKSMRKM